MCDCFKLSINGEELVVLSENHNVLLYHLNKYHFKHFS